MTILSVLIPTSKQLIPKFLCVSLQSVCVSTTFLFKKNECVQVIYRLEY